MKDLYKVLVLIFYVLSVGEGSNPLFRVIYAEIKPYIFHDSHGQLQGMLPEIFNLTNFFCSNFMQTHNYTSLAEFSAYTNYSSLIGRSLIEEPYGSGIMHEITEESAFWFPYLEGIEPAYLSHFQAKKLIPRQLFLIDRIAVIMPQRTISLNAKFSLGLKNCGSVAFMLFLLAISFSILVLIFERYQQKNRENYLILGFFEYCWLTIVTFVTVGYGDIYPRSVAGKFVSSVWMIVSVVIVAVITATITDTIVSGGKATLNGKRVAVLDHSNEERILRQSYNCTILPKDSILEVVESVRKNEADVGVIIAEIASWYKQAIQGDGDHNPLAVVHMIPVHIPVNMLFNHNKDTKELFHCMKEYWNEIVVFTHGEYTKEMVTETLAFENMHQMLHSPFYITLIAIAIFLFIFIMVCDFAKCLNVHFLDRCRNYKL